MLQNVFYEIDRKTNKTAPFGAALFIREGVAACAAMKKKKSCCPFDIFSIGESYVQNLPVK